MIKLCEEHTMEDFFNVGGGVVYNACTKCPYWEPYENSEEVIITIYDADGNIVEEGT